VRITLNVELLVILVLIVASTGCERQTQPTPDRPRLSANVRMQDVTFHSVALGRDMPYRVVLPSKVSAKEKLPVVYLLHGGGGSYRDWSNYSDVAQFAERGLILVMPEGNSSYYVNATARPADRYEDYVTQDLISDLEQKFPAATGQENRAIAGVSMGGYGAITLALKHPDLFGFAGGLSSALDVPSRPFSIKRIAQYRQHEGIFGPWGSRMRHDSDPYILAVSADPSKVPYLFLSCGDQEGLLPANKKFATILRVRGFQYEFHDGAGSHDWNQWNRRLPDLFASVAKHLKGASRSSANTGAANAPKL
jgi:putative tributyrin esterase